MFNVKGLTLHVYRWELCDCTNNGISSRYDTLILIGDGVEGPVTVDMENPPENVVTMVKRRIHGIGEHLHLEPLDGRHNGGNKWYMAGGNFAYTSDSRFPSSHPLAVHDRHEG